MTQQVNLYQDSFRREKSWLNARGILIISGALAALLLGLYGQASISAWLDVRNVAKLELRKAEQAQRLKELKAQVPGPSKGQVLAREIEALSQEGRVRERLYDVIVPGTGGNIEGFSSHLVGLARQRIHGVWLQTIRINEGGDDLKLVGYTLRPDGVPDLLEKLRSEPAYMGRDFRRLLLERTSGETNRVRFTISTREGAG